MRVLRPVTVLVPLSFVLLPRGCAGLLTYGVRAEFWSAYRREFSWLWRSSCVAVSMSLKSIKMWDTTALEATPAIPFTSAFSPDLLVCSRNKSTEADTAQSASVTVRREP